MSKIAPMVLAFVVEIGCEKILDRTSTGHINKDKEGKAPPVGKVPGRRWVYNDKGEHGKASPTFWQEAANCAIIVAWLYSYHREKEEVSCHCRRRSANNAAFTLSTR